MGWTTQQQTAIDARGCGLIVSAAAGSGKTSVLVERLTEIIADRRSPVPVEKMIIVTFTKDAAAEIRQRLSASLERAIAAAPEDTWLRRQQMLLPSAKIATINAFCFDIIREHMGDGEITSAFRVLDDSEQEILTLKAADEAICTWHRERPEDMTVLWDAFCHKSDRPLEELLKKLHEFFGSIPFRDAWIKKAMEEYRKPAAENIYYKSLLDGCRGEAAAIRRLCDRAVYLAGDLYESNNNVLEWVMEDYEAAAMLQKLLDEREPDTERINSFALKLMGLHNGKRYPAVRKKSVLNMARFEQVRDIRGEYDDRLKALLGRITSMLPYFENDMSEHIKLLPLLCQLEADMSAALWRMKTERNALSFDDGERLVLELLADTDENGNIRPSAAAREMAEYYELIMIDEYQDSNNKQDYIFRLMSRNGWNERTGTLRYGDNVFLVGDVKQCIYQFRNANPRNFSAAAADAEPYLENSCEPLQLIRLSKNFRSSRQTVAFVNYLFANLMTSECGEVDYTEEEWLYAGADGYDSVPYEEQAVAVAVLPEKEDAEDGTDQSVIYTAETIKKMLTEGYPVLDKSRVLRPCTPEDFCILVRKKKYAKGYSDALSRLGVPVKGIGESGYLKSKEVGLLLDLLRVLDNPLLETSLAAVMLSPMFSFTADDLAEVRLTDRSLSLYPAMCVLLERRECSDALYEKCRSLYETLAELRQISALYSLEELVRRIYETTDFLSVMQLYKDGAKKRANLHLLLRYARSYEENAGETGGITGFLRYVDIMLDKDKDFEQADDEKGSDNAVRVMSMHGSKGLEYPFVFICNTETEFSEQDNKQKLLCTDAGLAGLRLQNPDTLEKYQSLPHMVIINEMRRQRNSEELRLLYVALTRARQKLFIPLRYNAKDKAKLLSYAEQMRGSEDGIPRKLADSAETMADWLWMAIMLRGDKELTAIVPEAETIAQCSEDKYFPELKISYSNAYEPTGDITVSSEPMPAPDPVKLTEIRRLMEYEYSTKAQNEISLMSVSAASKAETGESLTLKRPRCTREKEKMLTGAEHGTAVHAFFQYARFAQAEKDTVSELQRLYRAGFLSEEQMRSVRPEDTEPFFRSELYARIRKSPKLYREKKFLVRISDLGIPENISDEALSAVLPFREAGSMMKGIIDLAFEENGGFVLVDYKTDYVRTEQELLEKYKLQLYIYSLALRRITGTEVRECLIYSTVLGRTIRSDFSNI